jgi:hypothetical protein
MKHWFALYSILSGVLIATLLLWDPRYYVMPGGPLADGLPIFGTDLPERFLRSATVGLALSGILLGVAILVRALCYQARVARSDSNSTVQPTRRKDRRAADRERWTVAWQLKPA